VTNEVPSDIDAKLRPLISRLKEIERKCDSMGTRNEEFPLMKERLTSMIARLEAGEEASGEPLDYRGMARDLFPVAHLFESVGFMSVGKEIAHVEKSLQNLAPESAVPAGKTAPTRPSATSSAAIAASPEATDRKQAETEETAEEPSRQRIPKPVLGAFVVLVVAIAVAATIVLKVRQQRAFSRQVAATPIPVVEPTPSAEAESAAVEATPDNSRSARERLAEALDQAGRSIEEGDVDAAVGYLAFAELINRNDPRVFEMADRLVDRLVDNANAAATQGEFEDAARNTAQARTVATRFKLDTKRISDAEHAHAEMQQFTIVSPDEIQVLRASIGKHVDIMLRDGSSFSGWLTGFKGSAMILDVEDDVGGGIVSFTDEFELDTVEWIRIQEN
jgi:hypothetical protein